MTGCEFCGKQAATEMTLVRDYKVLTAVYICRHCETLFRRLMLIAGVK